MAEPVARVEHHLAVLGRDGGAPAVLLVPEGSGWGLPRLASDDRASAETAALTREARALLGVEVSVLQCLLDVAASDGRPREQLHALEAHGTAWTPPAGARWAGAAAVRASTLSRPELAPLVARWLDECRADALAARGREWVRPGWRDQAIGWADRALARVGLGPVRAIEQVKAWEFAQVLRLGAGSGEFYLKALCESAAREARLTECLARAHPGSIPDVVAIDPDRRWVLARAVPGEDLMQASHADAWTATARRFARIQIAWAGRVDDLRALGCPHWPLDAVAARIAPMLADEACLLAPCPEGLTAAELDALRRRAPELAARCAELATIGIPDSLEHGDLWGSNVILGDGGPVFIDWEDATAAHPFLSPSLLLLTLPYSPALSPPAASDLRPRIRDTYLEAWQSDGPLRGWPASRLERAFDLAQQVAMVHYAVQFWLGAPLVETSWWVRTFAPFFLRRCLG